MPRKIKPTALAPEGAQTATNDADVFILRAGGGDETIAGFDPSEDRVLFDIGGAYTDVWFLGRVEETTYSNWTGTASITVSAVDQDGDGVTDTRIDTSTGDSVTLLGVEPGSLFGWNLMGG
jgi:hypothetical protein